MTPSRNIECMKPPAILTNMHCFFLCQTFCVVFWKSHQEKIIEKRHTCFFSIFLTAGQAKMNMYVCRVTLSLWCSALIYVFSVWIFKLEPCKWNRSPADDPLIKLKGQMKRCFPEFLFSFFPFNSLSHFHLFFFSFTLIPINFTTPMNNNLFVCALQMWWGCKWVWPEGVRKWRRVCQHTWVILL